MLSFLAAAPLTDLAVPLQPRWKDLRVKHMWNAVPANWESLGYPAAGTTIDLYIALKSHREDALIDALYEVSNPEGPKYVPSNTPPRTHILTCAAAHLQIWRAPF